MDGLNWYRNAGRGVYHRSKQPWNRNGEALCGADIRSPAFIARNLDEVERTRKRACEHCKKGT